MIADMSSHRFEADRLMVIIPDRLSDLVTKGEVTARYYNPGELFREVHIVMLNDDRPDPAAVQKMVGRASLHLHNIAPSRRFFMRTLGWRPWLLRVWASKVVDLARDVRPQMIRCHGSVYNAFAASEIKRRLHIPYVVSIHTNPDQTLGISFVERLKRLCADEVARIGLGNANVVLPVYEGIRPFLQRLGIDRVELAYNAVSPDNIARKSDYSLHDPVEIISVGRQLVGKDPTYLIHAVAQMDRVRLTLVGDGPLHQELQQFVARNHLGHRIAFVRSLPNEIICQKLAAYDLFAGQNEYWGVPKTIMEGMLAGLPIVINRPDPAYVPEITRQTALLVDNSPQGYRQGIEELISDKMKRKALGQAAAQFAWDKWNPGKTEARLADVYMSVLSTQETSVAVHASVATKVSSLPN